MDRDVERKTESGERSERTKPAGDVRALVQVSKAKRVQWVRKAHELFEVLPEEARESKSGGEPRKEGLYAPANMLHACGV